MRLARRFPDIEVVVFMFKKCGSVRVAALHSERGIFIWKKNEALREHVGQVHFDAQVGVA